MKYELLPASHPNAAGGERSHPCDELAAEASGDGKCAGSWTMIVAGYVVAFGAWLLFAYSALESLP